MINLLWSFIEGSIFERIKPPYLVLAISRTQIEYVDGYEELGIEDDKEDFGGLKIARSQMDNDNGKAVTR